MSIVESSASASGKEPSSAACACNPCQIPHIRMLETAAQARGSNFGPCPAIGLAGLRGARSCETTTTGTSTSASHGRRSAAGCCPGSDAPVQGPAPVDAPTLAPAPAVGQPTPAFAADLAAPAPKSRLALAHTAAITTTVATAVLSVFAGYFIPAQCYAASLERGEGAPDPVCTAMGIALGAALQVGLAVLLVPETYRLADDASGRGAISESRASAWRWGRWPALAGSIFVTTFVVGAFVEKANYGHGQAAMLTGALGTLASWITFDVLNVVGASAGYKESRRALP